MLVYILLIITVALPLIFIIEDKKPNFARYLLFLWVVSLFLSTIFIAIQYGGVANIFIIAIPMILRITLNFFRRTQYANSIDEAINSIISGFWSRCIKTSIVSIIVLLIFYSVGQAIYGIYIAFIIYIVLMLNIQSSINSKMSFFLFLITIWSIFTSDPQLGIKTNALITVISLFVVIVPLTVYKPIADNYTIHVMGFGIFIILSKFLQKYNEVIITALPSRLTTLLITLLILFAFIYLHRVLCNINFIKKKYYYAPIIVLVISIILSSIFDIYGKYLIENLAVSILDSIHYIISFNIIVMLLRFAGPILNEQKHYDLEGETSEYLILKQITYNWLGESFGEKLFNFFFGGQVSSDNKRKSYSLLLVSLLIIWTYLRFKSPGVRLMYIFDISSLGLMLWSMYNLIPSVIKLRILYKQSKSTEMKLTNQLTGSLYIGTILLLLAYNKDIYLLSRYFNIYVVIVTLVIQCLYLIIVLITFSSELSMGKNGINMIETKEMLCGWIILAILGVTANLFFAIKEIPMILFFSIYVTSFLLGLLVGELSSTKGRLYNNLIKFTEDSFVFDVLIVISSHLFIKPMIPLAYSIFGTMMFLRWRKNKSNIEINFK